MYLQKHETTNCKYTLDRQTDYSIFIIFADYYTWTRYLHTML